MHNLFETDWVGEESHPAEDDLLLYLDGELAAREAGAVRTHLEACWACRVKAEKIQETISAFIDYQNVVLTPHLEPPPQGWRTFAQQNRAVAESARRSALSTLLGSLVKVLSPPRLSLRLAAGLLAASVLVFLVTRTNSVPAVSAGELLRQAAASESRQVRGVAQPVVYQKLLVRRKTAASAQADSLTWEVWRDTANARFRQGVQDSDNGPDVRRLIPPEAQAPVTGTGRPAATALPPILIELEQVFSANHLDFRQPLSATGYEAWRESIGPKHEEVSRTTFADRGEALTLKTTPEGPVGLGAVVEAALVVRARDWHPVGQRWQVRGEGGDLVYELTETAYEVVSLNTVSPALFGEQPVTSSAATPTMPRGAPSPTPSFKPLPSAAELAVAELEARSALHRVGADLGEQIEVVRQPAGEVEVRGLTETAERKMELLAALQHIPHVALKIRTFEEAAREAASSRPSAPGRAAGAAAEIKGPPTAVATPTEERATQVVGSRAPMQGHLEKYFARRAAASEPRDVRRQVEEFSNRALALSGAALAEAWALRRLAERYRGAELAELSPPARRKLEALVRDHVKALRRRADASHVLLRPVLLSMTGDAGEGLNRAGRPSAEDWSEMDWPALAAPLFQTVRQVEQLTTGLLAGAGLSPRADARGPDGSPQARPSEKLARDLLAAFAALEAELPRLERRVAGEFIN